MLRRCVPAVWIGSAASTRDFPWTPIEPRPSEEDREAKLQWLLTLETTWNTVDDWICHHHLGAITRIDATGRHVASTPPKSYALVSNPYPYKCPQNTTHSVLWLSAPMKNEDVTQLLEQLLPRCDFVWYFNPTPTLNHTKLWRHAQVFHRDILQGSSSAAPL
jgi:hypothetical protein